jgi:divalent metal cation (Fe/Co/Zn/Cd) transporter
VNLVRKSLWLVGATLAYNVIEAVVAIASGISASSIALVGFGIDSVIECSASAFLLWRLWVEAKGASLARVEKAERSGAVFVGITFFALALYILLEAGWTLWKSDPPQESLIGIILAALSLAIMPALAWAKLSVARQMGSKALRAEAKETIACAYLSFTLLLGLLANALWGFWWADPLAALLMVPWLIREGLEAFRGEKQQMGDQV